MVTDSLKNREKYASLHEHFGYANLDTLSPTTEYFEKDDYLLARGHINTLKLSDGQFIVTFPEDAHIPNMKKLSEGVTVRAIAKIRV